MGDSILSETGTIPNDGIFVQPKKGNVLITFQNKELPTTVCPNIAGSGLGKFNRFVVTCN